MSLGFTKTEAFRYTYVFRSAITDRESKQQPAGSSQKTALLVTDNVLYSPPLPDLRSSAKRHDSGRPRRRCEVNNFPSGEGLYLIPIWSIARKPLTADLLYHCITRAMLQTDADITKHSYVGKAALAGHLCPQIEETRQANVVTEDIRLLTREPPPNEYVFWTIRRVPIGKYPEMVSRIMALSGVQRVWLYVLPVFDSLSLRGATSIGSDLIKMTARSCDRC
jgi:hypothetical protein